MFPSLHYLSWLIGLSGAVTQTTEAERECLVRHASGRKALVEIGVFEGVTTYVLREAMAHDGVLYAVDPFFRGRLGVSFQERIARREVARSTRGRVEWVRTTGVASARDPRLLDTAVDFVFVDGDHTWEAIEGDWNAWNGKVVPGGIIAFHDSRESQREAPELFVEQVVAADPRFELVDVEFRLTVFKRRGD